MTNGNLLNETPSIAIDALGLSEFVAAGVDLDLLRLDQVHPQISGNKWFKLKYAVQAVLLSDCQTVLSFGGAWSNHIHALAYAGFCLGIKTVGVIRGERPQQLSATLEDAVSWGMELHFVSRAAYRDKSSPSFIAQLEQQFGRFHLLPEGGSGDWVVAGCRDIVTQFDAVGYDLICCACGTGGTLAGLIAAKPDGAQLLGVSALKGGGFLYEDIRGLLQRASVSDPGGWRLALDDHEGGYAKITPELALEMARFTDQAGIELEPVYTGKAYLALLRALRRGELRAGQRILLIHTGGMQGARGMKEIMLKQLKRSEYEYNV